MAPDELNAPLGQAAKAKTRLQALMQKVPLSPPQLLAGLLGLSGLVVVAWAALVNDPLGGEPVVVVATKLPTAGDDKSGGSDGSRHYDGPAANVVLEKGKPANAAAAAPPAGAKTVTIIDGSSGKREEVVIPGSGGSPAPEAAGAGNAAARAPRAAADPKLLEPTRHGAIPKVGPDGARASLRYARPREIPTARKDFPRIAVIIGSMGISAAGTAEAFANLPPSMTFALAPYAADLERLAAQARGANREVLLQVPMEPFDYPDNDPGPQTLLTSLSGEQNVDRLHWLMSRFQGYVGVLSFMGSRFTASEQSLAPVLRETSKRGLIYVDDGGSSRSVAGQIAGSANLPFARTDVVLDAVPVAAEVDRALARLELAARENGSAVGLATGQPATIARIAEWAKKVESRGFVLVPISMVANKAKSS
ncbi:MAG: divergent polysaccharide deacetylase family protein [Pseudolabrys sp.]